MSKKVRNTAGLIAVTLLATACVDSSDDNNTTTDLGVNAPTITMELPVTLSGVVSSTKPSNKVAVLGAANPTNCEALFDPEGDFMENGYAMTRFLVGMSQMLSCHADFIIDATLANARQYIGQGIVEVPGSNSDPEAPTHFKIEQSGDTMQIWLMFAQGSTPDISSDQTIYLTWTESGSDVTGQYFMVNMPIDPNDPDAPEGVRVDFSRDATQDVNKIFLNMRDSHSGGIDGFRTEVVKNKSTNAESYEAKGLVSFIDAASVFDNSPASEQFDASTFTASTLLDTTGAGASIASFNNLVMHLEVPDAFNLGSYSFTLAHETYFSNAGITEWSGKSVPAADYVNTSGTNLRSGAANNIIAVYEGDIDKFDGDGNVVIPALSLGSGYFTDTCNDTDGADCTDYISAIATVGYGSFAAGDPIEDKPTDGRATLLTGIESNQLTQVHPDGQVDGSNTFVIPQP